MSSTCGDVGVKVGQYGETVRHAGNGLGHGHRPCEQRIGNAGRAGGLFDSAPFGFPPPPIIVSIINSGRRFARPCETSPELQHRGIFRSPLAGAVEADASKRVRPVAVGRQMRRLPIRSGPEIGGQSIVPDKPDANDGPRRRRDGLNQSHLEDPTALAVDQGRGG
ncbi:hypothetical protein M433DRAFT_7507 [Acidomyces richmondensis BFW]|nr:MAG: hypothetical protein FE78DRAFT_27940 [Acidomyces sp. 'richmondensis']KYG41998.1 hypothetical protein M433DRAFT_7507 [Acidomyces richmondensis BFW]